jgi:hypothetical protein
MRTAMVLLGLTIGGLYADELYYNGHHARVVSRMMAAIAVSFNR